MTVYVYTTRTLTFKKYIILRGPSLFDNGRVQSPLDHRHTSFYYASLHCPSQTFFFFKLKAKPFTSKKIMACFIAEVWNRTCNISEACLQLVWNLLYFIITMDLLTAKHTLPGQVLRDNSETSHHKVGFSTALILDTVMCPEASSPLSRQSNGGDEYCSVYQDPISHKICSVYR